MIVRLNRDDSKLKQTCLNGCNAENTENCRTRENHGFLSKRIPVNFSTPTAHSFLKKKRLKRSGSLLSDPSLMQDKFFLLRVYMHPYPVEVKFMVSNYSNNNFRNKFSRKSFVSKCV